MLTIPVIHMNISKLLEMNVNVIRKHEVILKKCRENAFLEYKTFSTFICLTFTSF